MSDVMRTRVKICGITRAEVAQAAARLGADASGVVVHARRPRAVTIEQARAVVRALPPFVTAVGLFVNAEPEAVHHVLKTVPLDLLQFHGDETPEVCRSYDRPYHTALRMRDDADLAALARPYDDVAGILGETYVEGVAGGTGLSFDWSRLPAHRTRPLILAGCRSPYDVAAAVTHVRPW